MYKFLVAVALSLCVVGCSGPQQIVAPCSGKPQKDVIAYIASVMVNEGMEITLVNEEAGIVQAKSTGHSWTSGGDRYWSVSMRHDTVIAVAKVVSTGSMASTTYYGDNTHSSHTWYWSVRNAIEQVCGVTVMIQKG
jgi:hypothetical protein